VKTLLAAAVITAALAGTVHAGFTRPPGADLVCTVADPTGTPLNVRTSPNGPVVNRFRNGTSVIIHDRQGQWAFAEGYDWASNDNMIGEGWIYFPYVTNCGWMHTP
jgi:hypothetical protein